MTAGGTSGAPQPAAVREEGAVLPSALLHQQPPGDTRSPQRGRSFAGGRGLGHQTRLRPSHARTEAPGAEAGFTYRLVPELLSLWAERRSSLCRPGVVPCFPTVPRAAEETPGCPRGYGHGAASRHQPPRHEQLGTGCPRGTSPTRPRSAGRPPPPHGSFISSARPPFPPSTAGYPGCRRFPCPAAALSAFAPRCHLPPKGPEDPEPKGDVLGRGRASCCSAEGTGRLLPPPGLGWGVRRREEPPQGRQRATRSCFRPALPPSRGAAVPNPAPLGGFAPPGA